MNFNAKMEMSFFARSIFVITLLCNGLLADFVSDVTSIIKTYSGACQLTLDGVTRNTSRYETIMCTNNTLLHKYTVHIGFCSDHEFYNLSASFCNVSYTEQADNEAKETFHAAVNNVSYSCQRKVFTCCDLSAVTTVLRQQEQYCPLMGSIGCCLVSGVYNCSTEEVNVLQYGACCADAMSTGRRTSIAMLSVYFERYCEFMNNQEGDFNLKTCLTNGSYCSESEFNTLNESACEEHTSLVTSHTTTMAAVTSTNSPKSKAIYDLDNKLTMKDKTRVAVPTNKGQAPHIAFLIKVYSVSVHPPVVTRHILEVKLVEL
ncbi:hypothetical protein Btru_019792 [Bulinus truncatus]|nr:hypothetical protein Btru_019792 [Bulinus truncatus]